MFVEFVVFYLVRICGTSFVAPEGFAFVVLDYSGACCAFGACEEFVYSVHGSFGVTGLGVQDCSVFVGEFDVVVIEDFSEFRAYAVLAAAHALSDDRVFVAHSPVDDVDIVDVLFDDMVAADPVEVIPVAHLVFHFGHAFFAWADPDAA